MYFLSEEVGWLLIGSAPDPVILFSTRDGGKKWDQQGVLGDKDLVPGDFLFVDPSRGIFIVNAVQQHTSKLLITNDGGGTYSEIDIGIPLPYTLNTLAAKEKQLWAIGQGLALRSDDMGQTWQQMLPQAEASTSPNLQQAIFQDGRILFVGDGGVFAFEGSSRKWNHVASFAGKLGGVWGASKLGDQVCVVGSAPKLFCSNDGVMWNVKSSLPLAPKNRVMALEIGNLFTNLVKSSSDTGWLLDESGHLFQSTDAGTTWRERKIPYACSKHN